MTSFFNPSKATPQSSVRQGISSDIPLVMNQEIIAQVIQPICQLCAFKKSNSTPAEIALDRNLKLLQEGVELIRNIALESSSNAPEMDSSSNLTL